MKTCKKCGKTMPENIRHKKCEYCWGKEVQDMKDFLKKAAGIAGVAVVAIASIALNDKK